MEHLIHNDLYCVSSLSGISDGSRDMSSDGEVFCSGTQKLCRLGGTTTQHREVRYHKKNLWEGRQSCWSNLEQIAIKHDLLWGWGGLYKTPLASGLGLDTLWIKSYYVVILGAYYWLWSQKLALGLWLRNNPIEVWFCHWFFKFVKNEISMAFIVFPSQAGLLSVQISKVTQICKV